jgi:hypothetical protein
MPPKPSDRCRKGHLKMGTNVIEHRRGGLIIKECRKCANARYRLKRAAKRRNQELLKENS